MSNYTDTSAFRCYTESRCIAGFVWMSLKENFRRNFSYWLASQDKKQKWVAEQLGVTETTITRWKKGTREPTLDQIGKIADLMGIPGSLLFEEGGLVAPRTVLARLQTEINNS